MQTARALSFAATIAKSLVPVAQSTLLEEEWKSRSPEPIGSAMALWKNTSTSSIHGYRSRVRWRPTEKKHSTSATAAFPRSGHSSRTRHARIRDEAAHSKSLLLFQEMQPRSSTPNLRRGRWVWSTPRRPAFYIHHRKSNYQ